jgi:hypothetical protein
MNKFLKNCGLYVAVIAFCIGMISCSSDNEDDMEGYSIRQLLVGEWELENTIPENEGDDIRKLNFDAKGCALYWEDELPEPDTYHHNWVYDPETRVLNFNKTYTGIYRRQSVCYTYQVVSISSKRLVLKPIVDGGQELHYTRVANYNSDYKSIGKYKRQDFYGSWEYSYDEVDGSDIDNPVTYTNKTQYTFSSEFLREESKDYIYGETKVRMDGRYWVYDPVLNVLEIGGTYFRSSYNDAESDENVIDPRRMLYRSLYFVDELTDEHMVLHQIPMYKEFDSTIITFNRVK